MSAVVKITANRGGTQVQGSGFVVGLGGERAMIVTTAHVIEGAQQVEVVFARDRTQRFSAEAPLGMDPESANGLAVFQVRGPLPAGVTSLEFAAESRPPPGTALFLIGFPNRELAPRTTRRVFSGWQGTLLVIDQQVGEGFSGGPVLQDGKVVGVVTTTETETTHAISALVAQASLEGWAIPLGGKMPPEVEPCVTGEERTENLMTFVHICPGTFTMGSAEDDPQADPDEKPAHSVTLSGFWIGKTEVTLSLQKCPDCLR